MVRSRLTEAGAEAATMEWTVQDGEVREPVTGEALTGAAELGDVAGGGEPSRCREVGAGHGARREGGRTERSEGGGRGARGGGAGPWARGARGRAGGGAGGGGAVAGGPCVGRAQRNRRDECGDVGTLRQAA